MANKMLIDAAHPEETRVVVVRGSKVEEFDFESANRRQLRGNIYLAKVTRVEPSLQAAFVEYGGNRHGFLAFSEIHPDYYQIPVADRQALLEEEARAERDEEREDERRRSHHRRRARHGPAHGAATRPSGPKPRRMKRLEPTWPGTTPSRPTAGEPAADPHAAEAAAPRAMRPMRPSATWRPGPPRRIAPPNPTSRRLPSCKRPSQANLAGEPNDSALAGDADAHAPGESALDSREPEARREVQPGQRSERRG